MKKNTALLLMYSPAGWAARRVHQLDDWNGTAAPASSAVLQLHTFNQDQDCIQRSLTSPGHLFSRVPSLTAPPKGGMMPPCCKCTCEQRGYLQKVHSSSWRYGFDGHSQVARRALYIIDQSQWWIGLLGIVVKLNSSLVKWVFLEIYVFMKPCCAL